MAKLKGNLHLHTVLSDGVKTPSQVIDIYKNLGYDFIAFTDHETLIGPDYLSQLPDDDDELTIFKGIELSEKLLSHQHIGEIYGNKETLHVLNHPSLYGMTIEDILHAIGILSKKYRIDCIDVSHYGDYTPQYDKDLIPLPKIVTDDAHRDGMFGNAWIEVEAKKDKDDILRNIKKGNFTKHFKRY